MLSPGARIILLAVATAVGLSVAMAVSAQETDVRIENEPPTLESVSVSSATLTPAAGGQTDLSLSVQARDLNGHNDVAQVTIEVRRPDGTTFANTSAPAVATASGSSITYGWVVSLPFYEPPGTWQVLASVTDVAGATADNGAAPATFVYSSLVAMQLGADAVTFGTAVRPGVVTPAQALAVTNLGNVQIDVAVAGTALAQADGTVTIPVERMTYSVQEGMQAATALTTTPTTVPPFNLAAGPASAAALYWQLSVPTAEEQYIPAGTYRGTVTVSAVEG